MSDCNTHTCEKAAPGWRDDSRLCLQCESDKRLSALFAEIPVRKPGAEPVDLDGDGQPG